MTPNSHAEGGIAEQSTAERATTDDGPDDRSATTQPDSEDDPDVGRRDVLRSVAAAGAFSALGLGGAAGSASAAHDQGLSQTPPMGWNSWNTFGCDIDEGLIRDTADAMVTSGMAAAGYEYVNLDDCWMAHTRDSNGDLVANTTRFPSGMAALAEYVHDQGLEIGLYESAGTEPCASENNQYSAPGCLNNEYNDANTFARWGIDYLKYDNCGGHGGQSAWERFLRMSDALDQSGRDIVYSQCSWGQEGAEWTWAWRHGANLWRTTADITDSWDEGKSACDNNFFMGVTDIVDFQDCEDMHRYANWGHWNDPDMLEVGNPGLSETESRAHFGMWCLMAAPLIAGNDLRNMSQSTVDVLTNQEVVDVDQDPAGVQGRKVRDDGDREVWAKPLVDNEVAVGLFNRGSSSATISTMAAEVGLPSATDYVVRDLHAHTESISSGGISASVPAHGLALFRVTVNSGGADTRPTEYLSDWHWMAAYNGWNDVQRDASVDGNPITLNGTTYSKGLGTHAHSQVVYSLGGGYDRFQADVGIDDEVDGESASARFEVWGDGSKLYESPDVTPSSATESVDVSVSGVNTLKLITTPVSNSDGIDYDHTDWADARVSSGGGGGDGPIDEGTYIIENVNSGKLLDVYQNGTADGDDVIQWADNGGENQQWEAVRNADGSYHFLNVNSGKALAVEGGGTADGDTVVQWGYDGGSNQHWDVVDNGDGTYRLANVNSGKVADVDDGSTADGADVIQWAWHGGDNQKWTFSSI
ncbi:alpha-galactosidase [Halomicrobium zhouii]|uniref:Melibiase A n=1 Tax=Halomicrobium zhouii TaxID=767519 RepID=A0A1I6KPA7_9EURY|nr:NPCBM/NEW2 domain-containing protein [Halomicrobium zhouii]SFR92828.1 alpha-galactosidase [Halomicrobium zhouii]